MRLPSCLAAAFAAALLALAACTGGPRVEVPLPTTAERDWRLPATVPMPAGNVSTPARIELGKALFFDRRLSGSTDMACVSCHLPDLGWTDGRKTAVMTTGEVLPRASPTILNTGFNTIYMWDGRKASLEDQAMGPHKHLSVAEYKAASARLARIPGYQKLFAAAYPGEPIQQETISKALAAFERTLVSRDSPFDRWLAGDTKALTPQQYRGFRVFVDSGKGNCAACHNGPNFTDNGFHNIGIKGQDEGRYPFRKLAAMKGAFKTPTLRDIELTAPYFHDGSAASLRDVVEYYARGGEDRSNVSPDLRPLKLTEHDKDDLVAFLRALTGRRAPFVEPVLPQ
jgi:cytochrome c peroxidase